MKKMRILAAVLFFVIAILAASFVQAAVIESTKNNYLTTESVGAKSTAVLCNNLPQGEDVELYIVQEQEWKDGNPLNDVRGNPTSIPNLMFSYRKIWENPEVGGYDIIVDCTGNRDYNTLEPIDSLTEVGFRVTAIAGTGQASIGEQDIGTHFWMYDSEAPDLINEMLQVGLLVNSEDIELDNITLQASGTGNDIEIDKLEVYVDENNNGRVDENEVAIGDSQPAYSEDNGITTLVLDYTLTKGIKENILIAYTMKKTTPEGTFSLKVGSIEGTGKNSGKIIIFSGLPLESGIKTVLPEKTCFGSLKLGLEPNPALRDSAVIARMSGMEGCQNKTIDLRVNPCGSSLAEKTGFCILEDGECEINFTSTTNQTYYACTDKNGDGDMTDFGEYVFEDLVVIEPEVKEEVEEAKKENVTEKVNVTEEQKTGEENESAGITGKALSIGEKISETSSFFILLEITLLLILFVLVMIMFRLKVSGKSKSETGEETEEKE